MGESAPWSPYIRNPRIYCRLCLEERTFFPTEGLTPRRLKMICELFNFDLIKEDKWPTKLCTKCMSCLDAFYMFKEIVVRNQNLLFKSKIDALDVDKSPEQFPSIVHIKLEPLLGEDPIHETGLAITSVNSVAAECPEYQKELASIKTEDDPLAGGAGILDVPDPLSGIKVDPLASAEMPSESHYQRHPQRSVNGHSTESGERRKESLKRSWTQANNETDEDTADEESQGETEGELASDDEEREEPEERQTPLRKGRRPTSFGLPILPELPSLPSLPKLPRLPKLSKLVESPVAEDVEPPEDEVTEAYSLKYEQWSLHVDASIKRFFPALPCKLCARTFESFGALRLHVDSCHHGEKEFFACCGRSFVTRTDLRNHINYHVSMNRVLACHPCLLVFPTASKLTEHKLDFHGTGFPCHFCNAEFGSQLQMSKHVISHFPVSSIGCPKCPSRSFASRELLQRHLEKDHPAAEFFECTICPFKLDIKSQLLLREPLTREMCTSNFLCPHCGASFSDARDFLRHVSRGRMEEPGNSLDCPDCGLVFPNMKRLRMHVANVHDRKGA